MEGLDPPQPLGPLPEKGKAQLFWEVLKQLRIESIRPNSLQPRRRFDENALLALSDSILELGVLQPVLVREVPDGTYELIAGERRWRAAQLAGLEEIPAVVRQVGDKTSLEQAVVENLHREDLNPMEEAAAFQRLIDEFGQSADDVAIRVGKSRPSVANSLRLFQLSAPLQRLVADGSLTAGHARALLSLPVSDRQHFADRVLTEELSVRMLERLIKRHLTAGSRPVNADPSPLGGDRSAALLEVENRLGDRLDTRVMASLPKQGNGKLVIEFADLDDLGRIFSELSEGSGT